jgi:hypothetical protein
VGRREENNDMKDGVWRESLLFMRENQVYSGGKSRVPKTSREQDMESLSHFSSLLLDKVLATFLLSLKVYSMSDGC